MLWLASRYEFWRTIALAGKKGQFNMWTISSSEFKTHVGGIRLPESARQKLSEVNRDQYSISKDQQEKIDRSANRSAKSALTGNARRKVTV